MNSGSSGGELPHTDGYSAHQWRFYVEARGHRPPNLAQAPKFFQGNLGTGQLDTVVLLLVDEIGCIVISLRLCCLPNDEGPATLNIFS